MKLNIKQLESVHGASPRPLEFSGELDLSALRMMGESPYPEPVRIAGKAHRQANLVALDYSVRCTLNTECARCLKPVRVPQEFSFSHTVVEEIEDESSEEDFVVAHGGVVDLEEVAAGDLIPEWQSHVLCSPDCRGLCPKCGADRNEVDCGCPEKEPDPRFDALRDILNDNS